MADARDSNNPSQDTNKSASAFRTISEVATELEVPQHVLRFWETKFAQVKPLKRGGGRRYYRPEDIALIRGIRDLLYKNGYTIRGVQRLFRENGAKAVLTETEPAPPQAPAQPATSNQLELKMDGQNKRAELAEIVGELRDLRDLLRSAGAL